MFSSLAQGCQGQKGEVEAPGGGIRAGCWGPAGSGKSKGVGNNVIQVWSRREGKGRTDEGRKGEERQVLVEQGVKPGELGRGEGMPDEITPPSMGRQPGLLHAHSFLK